VAGHELIDAYLAELAERLPADVVDELADGLTTTWQHHRDAGLDANVAAQAAITEFGSINQITTAFVTLAPGRRLSRILLASGPVVGGTWGLSLAYGRAWTWPVPTAVAAGYFLVLLTVVAALVAAATSRHNYRRTRLGTLGAFGLIGLDVVMVAAALHLAGFIWPLTMAIPASVARVAIVLSRIPRDLAT
jgi:hypothetical protein